MNEQPTAIIEMSMPPGVNKAYDPVRTATRAKIVKNNVARQWADYARNQIVMQAPDVKCPNRFKLLIQFAENKLDTDAPIKEIIDALKNAEMIKDDKSKYNMELTVQVVEGLKPNWVRITIWALSDDYTKPCVGDFGIEDCAMPRLL